MKIKGLCSAWEAVAQLTSSRARKACLFNKIHCIENESLTLL